MALIRPSTDDVNSPLTLPHLTTSQKHGLTAVSAVALVSLIAASASFLCITIRVLIINRHRQAPAHQILVLIFNLILADITQSVGFVLDAQHVIRNSITIGTATCWAQGWFISTGDLASGIFTLAIAVHSFADIVFDYRLSHRAFITTITALWAFNYVCAIAGVAMHPADFYARAGPWCWINQKYTSERLWLHYFWMLVIESGTLLAYAVVFFILRRRVRAKAYADIDAQIRAQAVAKLVIAYPIIYILSTLPLVIARLKTMTGQQVTFTELCISGAMITSNGWLDVLLYSITRRSLLFGPSMSAQSTNALDTFNTFTNYRADFEYGTHTTIEATLNRAQPSVGRNSRNESTEDLFQPRGTVKAETVVHIHSEEMELSKMATVQYNDAGDPDEIATLKFRSSLEEFKK